MLKLIFASSNQHKIAEMRQLISNKIEIISSAEAGILEDIPETGSSFRENAALKAKYIWSKTQMPCFADDSGLSCNALQGEPGIFSARYAGTGKSTDNIDLLLSNLEKYEDRSARFICVICLINQNEEYFFNGEISGSISMQIKGKDGFGYDPVFIPEGMEQTFAEMDSLQKNSISHRALAMQKFMAFLEAGAL